MNYFTNDWFSDSAIMYDILNSLTLYTGNERSGSKFFIKNDRKIKKPQSTKLGCTWRQKIGKKDRTYCPILKGYKTKLYEDHPELFDIFNEFRDLYFKDFEFDSVTINKMGKGVSVKPHFDKINVGDSILCAFGDYNGGETFIQQTDKKFKIIDCRDGIQKFNGAKIYHFVNTVKEGLRYSLVFYNSKNKIKI